MQLIKPKSNFCYWVIDLIIVLDILYNATHLKLLAPTW